MSRKNITLKEAQEFIDKFNINTEIVPLDIFRYGMVVELEHGTMFPLSNITNDNLLKTAKIVLAHLQEAPDYYQRLKKMEQKFEKYWEEHKKPNIFNE
jgi:hypothetical protein